MQEFRADASIGSDRSRHLLNVRPDRLAQIGDLVDEGYLHRQECIRGIFGEFCRLGTNKDDRRIAQREGLIKAPHNFAAAPVYDRRSFEKKQDLRTRRESALAADALGFQLNWEGEGPETVGSAASLRGISPSARAWSAATASASIPIT